MAAPSNLGFETPGPTAGSALGWDVTITATYEQWAGFGVENLSAESFETEWGNDPFLFEFDGVGLDLDPAMITTDYVTPATSDDFETGWSNSGFLFSLSNISTGIVDDFETGWLNVPYITSLGSISSGVFDGNNFENFEQSWRNTGYLTSLSSTATASINAPGGGVPYEGFEYYLGDLEIASFSQNTPVITLVGTRNFSDGDFLYLVGPEVGSVLPTPFGEGTRYIVHVLTASTFELSIVNVIGPYIGPATDAGVGPWYTRVSPLLYWTGPGPGV